MLLTDSEAPSWARRLAWLLLALLVAIVAGVGVLIWSSTHPTPPPTKAAPSASPSGSPDSDSVCGLASGSGAVPEQPPVTEWKVKGKFLYPHSDELGPGQETQNVGGCYAHSPAGALLAAAGFAVDAETVTLSALDAMSDRVVGKRALAVTKARLANNPTSGGWQIAGYRFVDATPSRATVELLIRATATGSYAAFTSTMDWQRGDWRYVLPKKIATRQPVDPFGADGFTQWEATS
ncbi:MAG: hypothetical protein BWY79_00741 [Actinobacteria bacterium ADurb.Bin444]|nr:MAG: hypothetical protein BWY79_00741 [Actinobacteria bacterium ADurb.Bin444]